MENDNKNIGWNFDNTYSLLPSILMKKTFPTPVKKPKLIVLNYELAKDLDLNFQNQDNNILSNIFSGNKLPDNTSCIAQAYAGHQFGHFTMLGDGRAILIGEHITKNKKRFDIQFKGSGITPYSRNGDGRAALAPMLREYLISEAMYYLNIPTTRSLAVTTTGEDVIREKILDGAILTRIASSHIRIGTFQFLSMQEDTKTLSKLVNYTIDRHYSKSPIKENLAITLLEGLIEKQISLIVDWIRVGFIMGVMNTDNMTLSGETIDYGPCAFMDYYNPNQVYSSIDHQGRYSFSNQELICHWNLSRFAETLIPLLGSNYNESIKIGRKIINKFNDKFKEKWLNMMKSKLGFNGNFPEDENLIKKILNWMEKNNADYTNTFVQFMHKGNHSLDIYMGQEFISLYQEWESRIDKNKISKKKMYKLMQDNNPITIPRNFLVEKALYEATENKDYNKFNELLKQIKKPYEFNDDSFKLNMLPSKEFSKNYRTYCGT